MVRIKICGLTNTGQALEALSAGADFIGLVFAPSRRQITLEKAAEISAAVRSRKAQTKIVGVFVNTPAGEVNRIAETCALDWVQLSGEETWEGCQKIQRPVIKTLHISPGSTPEKVREDIRQGYARLPAERLICLLDTEVKEAYGGTGQSFNREIGREIAARFPVIIAGGLTPQNVGELIREVAPWGVDVSSGVETGGRKDIHKIRYFIQQVKSLERSV